MAETTRAFVALRLPLEAEQSAAAVLERLQERCPRGDVKWVAAANLHVTLRFFGDLAPGALERARALLAALDGEFSALATGWSELGAFPSRRRPQVIWLGLADEAGELRGFAQEVNDRLQRAGFGRPDKAFRAHVTLGRVRRGRRVSWDALSDGLTTPQLVFSIQKAALFKSQLTGQGPIYTLLQTACARA